MASELIIQVDGDTSGLENKLKNAAGSGTRAFEKMGTSGVSSVNNITAAVGKLAKAVSGIAIAKKVAELGKESIKLASDLTEVQNVIDVTFGEGNQKIENFAKNASSQFGMSELAAKQYTGTMGAMLKSMQVDNVEDMSTALVGLAGDMASFYNLDVDEAFSKIRSGISGETEPLKQLGINMSVANLEAFALSQGLDKSYQSMTQAEQATLRYNYLLSATADAQGDFSRTSDSMANQLKIAQLNLENIKASLGQALLPAATAATTAFNNLLTNAQNAFPALKETVVGAVDEIRAKLEEFGLFDALTSAFETVKTTINEVIGTIITTFDGIANSPATQAVKEALSETFGGLVEQIGPLGNYVGEVGDYIQQLIEFFGKLWDVVGPILAGVISLIDDVVAAVIGVATTAMNIWQAVIQVLSAGFDLIVGLFTGNGQMIETSVNTIKTTIKNAFTEAYNSVCDIVSDLWKAVKGAFSKVKTTIKETFNIDLKATGQKIVKSLQDGIESKWQSLLRWFEEKINALVDKLPNFIKEGFGIEGGVKLSNYSKSANYSEDKTTEEKQTMGYSARPDQSLNRSSKASTDEDEGILTSLSKKSLDEFEHLTGTECDYVEDARRAIDDLMHGTENWLKEGEETNQKAITGLNNDMNTGFNSVSGGGSGTNEGGYTAADEAREMVDDFYNTYDEYGRRVLDFNGKGTAVRDYVAARLPGVYFGDMTQEDWNTLATMPASEGYYQGMYSSPKQTDTKASYTTAETTTVGSDGSLLGNLSVLAQGVSDQAIQSWLNLDAALQQVMKTLNGGGEGEGAAAGAAEGAEGAGQGLLGIMTNISNLFNSGVPTGIETMCTALEETLPPAVNTALQCLGNFNDEGEATGGNTLYTSIGAIKGVFEDINAAIDILIDYMENQLPGVVNRFRDTTGALEGMLSGIETAAQGAADEFKRLADNIQAAIDAYSNFNDAGVTAPSLPGGSPGHAHGGLLRGVGLVGEQGPEIISTSRNMNVFTNRALQIAQNKIAGQLARTAYVGTDSGSTSISNNNSRNASISIGTVLGADWVKSEVNQQIERIIRREMFYAS